MKMLIKNGHVWNGEEYEIKNIIITEGMIEDITNSDKSSFEGEVIDAKGKYILPGIINCHVHLFMNAGTQMDKLLPKTKSEALLEAVVNANKTIKSGVTTVRDCGSLGLEILALRDEINKGSSRITGPRILTCGQPIKITGGHFIGRCVDGIDEAKKEARKLISEGVDFLKFTASGGFGKVGEDPEVTELDEEEIVAAVKEAEKYKMASAAHCEGKQSMINALNAGVTTLEHCAYMDDEVIKKIIEKDIFVVPTFSPSLLTAEKGNEAGIFKYMVDIAKKMYKEKVPRFSEAYKSGIKIAFGNDAGSQFTKHEDFIVEMKAMESVGMSRKDIIASATQNAASALKLWDKIGSIEKGKYGDIVILEGNPLDDLDNFKKLNMVIKEGNKIC